jgi:tRNA 2-selenouridine synthase
MVTKIQIEALWQHLEDKVLLDVRSPAEFEKGHIPGAVSFPLFSNEERAEVGTIYKQENPEAAMLVGLDFVGKKMRYFVEAAGKIARRKKVVVHCWRGGKRSGSIAWLLDMAGFEVDVLEGGYKAYRTFLLAKFANEYPEMIILGGYTGSAKTEILLALREKGEQFLDLEGIANHKGSAFGSLGKDDQPSVEQFENNLFEAFSKIDTTKHFWVEDESKSIGRVYVPQFFWATMRKMPVIFLQRPIELRIKHLVKGYACYSSSELGESFEKIQKRLGGQHLKSALQFLEEKNYAGAARIALKYYDKAYANALNNRRETCELIPFETREENPEIIAEHLIKFVEDGFVKGY